MKVTQVINGTKFIYEVLKCVGERNKKKWYKVRNIETGFVCILVEGDFEILNDCSDPQGN